MRFSVATFGAGHGRYLFPAGFSIGLLLMSGLHGYLGWRRQRVVTLLVVAGMAAYAVWLPIARVLPKYAPPPTIAPAELPADAVRADLFVVPGLELAAYRTGADRVVPGQYLPVTLYWRAVGDPTGRQDPWIQLELVSPDDAPLDSESGWPTPGLAPAVWNPDRLYVTHRTLHAPPAELPAELGLALTPTSGPDTAGDRIAFAALLTAGGISQVDDQAVPNPRRERLGSAVQLAGYDLAPDPAAPGDTVVLDLYWRVLEAPAEDYTVFVHLLDADGALVTQFDRPAGGDAGRSSSWRAGQTWRDSYPLTIPEGPRPATIRSGSACTPGPRWTGCRSRWTARPWGTASSWAGCGSNRDGFRRLDASSGLTRLGRGRCQGGEMLDARRWPVIQ